jgi:hypothetical protein
MRRTRAILLGLFIASLALPPAAWAVTTVQGTDGAGYAGAAQKDATTVNAAHPTGQTRCIESARGYTMVTPSGQTVTMNSCATGTWSTTDIIPPPQYFLPGSITGLGTITTTATGSSTATGTYTITATATGTGTCAGTGTLTGTQTVSGTASATATGTGTKTVTATGIGTGSSTTTEMNISIGNASAAPGMFSLGSSGQAQFDSFGQLLLNRVITAGTSPLSIGSNVIGFNDRFGVYGSYGFAAKIGVTNGNIIFSTAPIGTYFTTVAETGRFAICQAGEIDIGNTTCGAYLLRVGASGTAGFDGSANVFANNINATPTASFIPQADTNHHIAIGWLPCTTSATPGGCPLADGTGKIDPSWIPPSSATSTSTATGTGNANFMAKWTTYTQTSTTTGTATITVTVTSLTNSTAYDNGNIGINKTNPATTLDVNGDVSANNITATPAANKVVKSRTTPATIDPAWLPGDRFVCGHGLDADVVCTASDVGADPVGAGTTAANAAVSGTSGQWAAFTGSNAVGNAPFTPMNGTVTHVSGDVPTSQVIAGKTLTSTNVAITAADVGAVPASQTLTGQGGIVYVYRSGTGTSTATATTTNTSIAAITGISNTVTSTGTGVATVAVFPNSTKTWTGTQTVSQTDIGQTTPASGVIPVSTASNLNNWITGAPANAFVAAGSNVAISSTAPSGASQVLMTTDATHATWQTPAAGVSLSVSTPTAETYGGAGTVGVGSTAARADHVHPLSQINSGQITGALGFTPVAGTGVSGTHVTAGNFENGLMTAASSLNSGDLDTARGSWVVPGTYSKVTLAASGFATGATNINSTDVTNALGYTPPHGSGTTGGLAYWSSSNTLGSTANLTPTPTPNVVPVADGSGTLNSWITNDITGSGTTGGLAYFTGSKVIASTVEANNTPTPSVIPVSDGSGSLNSWVNGRLLAASSGSNGIDAPTDTFGNWTTVASTVISPTATATVVAHAMFTVGASGVTTCYMRLYDSVPAAPMGPENRFAAVGAGYAPMFNVASTTVAAGSHTIAAQLRAIAGSTCTVPANLSNLVVEVFQ